jgi:hypothetical protein
VLGLRDPQIVQVLFFNHRILRILRNYKRRLAVESWAFLLFHSVSSVVQLFFFVVVSTGECPLLCPGERIEYPISNKENSGFPGANPAATAA